MDFRKAFDTIPRYNLWNRLEELKVPLELRVAAIRLYKNVIAKLKSNEGWSKDIKCNIVMQEHPACHDSVKSQRGLKVADYMDRFFF